MSLPVDGAGGGAAAAARAREAEALLKEKEDEAANKKKKRGFTIREGWDIRPVSEHLKIDLMPVQVNAVEGGPNEACTWCAGTMVGYDKEKKGFQPGVYHTTWYCKKTPAEVARVCAEAGLPEGSLGPDVLKDCMPVYTQACLEAGTVPRYSARTPSFRQQS